MQPSIAADLGTVEARNSSSKGEALPFSSEEVWFLLPLARSAGATTASGM